MRRLIWIYAVCKSLLLSPVAVKELSALINHINRIRSPFITGTYGETNSHIGLPSLQSTVAVDFKETIIVNVRLPGYRSAAHLRYVFRISKANELATDGLSFDERPRQIQ